MGAENVYKKVFNNRGEVMTLSMNQLRGMPQKRRQGWEVRVRRWWENLPDEYKRDDVDMRKPGWSRKLKEHARTIYPIDGDNIIYGEL